MREWSFYMMLDRPRENPTAAGEADQQCAEAVTDIVILPGNHYGATNRMPGQSFWRIIPTHTYRSGQTGLERLAYIVEMVRRQP